jgi:hypothetical protein
MKFKGKYDVLVETAITRFEQGGLLSGDLVRFRKDAMKNEKVKALTDHFKAMLEDAMNTDLNLRVSAVKSIRATTTGNYEGGHNSGTDSPTDHWVDIVVEYAPGLWRDPMTVPMEVLEYVDTNGNLAPIPDSLVRKSDIDMPSEVESPDADRKTPTSNAKPEHLANVDDGRTQAKAPTEVKKKNQGKLTLEAVFDSMVGAEPGAAPGAAPGAELGLSDGNGRFTGYTVRFGEPYGKNPEEVINKIQTMPGLSNNMNSEFSDDNTLTIKVDADVDPKQLEDMISNIVSGTVEVSKDEGMTEFEPQGAVVSSGDSSVSGL